MELIMIEQFKKHHMSMLTQSLLSDSRMVKLSRSEEEEDIELNQLKSEKDFESSEKISSVSGSVLYKISFTNINISCNININLIIFALFYEANFGIYIASIIEMHCMYD